MQHNCEQVLLRSAIQSLFPQQLTLVQMPLSSPNRLLKTSLAAYANASAIAVTIPPYSSVAYPIGAQITFAQYGAGQPTISGGSGVTVVSTGATAATPKLRAQYSTATAIQTSTNTWLVVGDIA